MPRAPVNGIFLEYERIGPAEGSPLLVISGFGSQMVAIDEGFCQALTERGFQVIRFDNRDVGLSSRVTELYGLGDMAADAVGLLDHCGIAAAHVAGVSMGGMIAQLVATDHPQRVLSLTSIMSALGGEDMVPFEAEVAEAWLSAPPTDREGYIEHSLRTQRLNWAGDFDETIARNRTARQYDRAFDLEGVARQRQALGAAGSRKEAVGKLSVPALVVHGDADPLVPLENGVRTAAAIPGSELVIIPGMGHYLAPRAWDRIADAIALSAARS